MVFAQHCLCHLLHACRGSAPLLQQEAVGNLVRQYWGSERLYHHTAPINMNYALHEALRIVLEEGLSARWERHALHHRALKAGLEAMGLRYLADPDHLLPMLNAVAAPDTVDEAAVRKRLLLEHGIEFGGGLGEFKGRAWRIGLMGESATRGHVTAALSALEGILVKRGIIKTPGVALAAARDLYGER